MATNPPKDNSRKGAVKDRFQFFNPRTKLWVKYNTKDKKIIDNKTSNPGKKYKGVRRKKK